MSNKKNIWEEIQKLVEGDVVDFKKAKDKKAVAAVDAKLGKLPPGMDLGGPKLSPPARTGKSPAAHKKGAFEGDTEILIQKFKNIKHLGIDPTKMASQIDQAVSEVFAYNEDELDSGSSVDREYTVVVKKWEEFLKILDQFLTNGPV